MSRHPLDRRRRPDALALKPELMEQISPREIACILRTTRFFAWAWQGLGYLTTRDHLPPSFHQAGDDERSECFEWEDQGDGVRYGYRKPLLEILRRLHPRLFPGDRRREQARAGG